MFFKDKVQVLDIMKKASNGVGKLYKPVISNSKQVIYKFHEETEVDFRELWITFVDVGGRATLVSIAYIPECKPYKDNIEFEENIALFLEESFLDDNLRDAIKKDNIADEEEVVFLINYFLKKTYGMVENP